MWFSRSLIFFSLLVLVSGCQDISLQFLKPNEEKNPAQMLKISESNPGFLATHFGGSVKLLDGRILILGSSGLFPEKLNARIFDPVKNKVSLAGNFPFESVSILMTVLTNGKVLVTGGQNFSSYDFISDTALYDPPTNKWEVVGSLKALRSIGALISLSDGRAFVVGGDTPTAEIFDPQLKSWRRTSDHPRNLVGLTAVAINDNEVLVFGGASYDAYLFDLLNETWTKTDSLSTPRLLAQGVLLSNGNVLALGGAGFDSIAVASGEVFDVTSKKWSPIPPMADARLRFAMTRITSESFLVCGGQLDYAAVVDTCEIFNEQSLTWSPHFYSEIAKGYTQIYKLNDGRVFSTGGIIGASLTNTYSFIDPINHTTIKSPFNSGDKIGGRTVKLDSDKILFTAGNSKASAIYNTKTKSWMTVGETGSERQSAHAFRLIDGRVLLAGGDSLGIGGYSVLSTEIFNPLTNTWSEIGNMNEGRFSSGSFSLPDGRVFIAGGRVSDTTEVFNPQTNTWSYGDDLRAPVIDPGVTKDSNGNVYFFCNEIQKFDTASETWSVVSQLTSTRIDSKAISLPDNKILIIGGADPNNNEAYSSTEIFDSESNAIVDGPSMLIPRVGFTATKLKDGRFVVVGGRKRFPNGEKTNSIEIFDPKTQSWSGYSINLSSGKSDHTATLTDENELLIWGG